MPKTNVTSVAWSKESAEWQLNVNIPINLIILEACVRHATASSSGNVKCLRGKVSQVDEN